MSIRSQLDAILRPRGVAVVGASSDPTKRGHQVVRSLVESGYDGGVYPVNPRGGLLLGLPVARRVEEVDGNVDLALICTPAASVPGVLESCVRKGVRGAVLLASGFGEAGPEGQALEARALEIARGGGIRLVGPNTSGVLNLGIDLNLIGVRGLRRGNLALLVQSGNTALSLLSRAADWGGGVSICVGVGNETDIRFHEYLEYLALDPDTRAILMYVDGFRDGRRFLRAARRVTRSKPIVLLKGGRCDAGVAAARSHTGAVAGEYRTLQAALRQAGVIEAERSDELLAVAEALAGQPPVRHGGGVAVLADGGGQAVVAVDALTARDVPLASLSGETGDRLRRLLGPAAAVGNPVDVAGAGDRDPAIFAEALQVLADDPSVGGVLLVGLFGGYALRFAQELAPAEATAAAGMTATMARARKPLIVHSIYANSRSEPLRHLYRSGVPVVESVEVACAAMAALRQRGFDLAVKPLRNGVSHGAGNGARPRRRALVRPALDRVRREGRSVLLESEARGVLSRYLVAFPPARLCASPEAARDAAARFGGPVAMKVVSPALPHKSEAGGVTLHVPDPDAAVRVFQEMMEVVSRHLGNGNDRPDIRGILVSPMLPTPVAELLVGVRRDPTFGPVVTFGAGGTTVELLRDTSLRVLPIRREDALAMLEEVRIGALLNGYRGSQAVDREPLVNTLLSLARCLLENPDIGEIEVNPLFAYPDRVVAVDVRAYLDDAAS